MRLLFNDGKEEQPTAERGSRMVDRDRLGTNAYLCTEQDPRACTESCRYYKQEPEVQ